MQKLYKLTDKNDCTMGGTQWGENVTHAAPGNGPLCSSAWLHAYIDPILAVLLNPVHADIKSPHIWECEGEVGATDHGLKVGCTSLTTQRRIPLPRVNRIQRVSFGILCAMEVRKNDDPSFLAWARAWLSGKDRSASASDATAAAASAYDAAYVSAYVSVSASAAYAARRGGLDLAAIAKQARAVK
jgi:hypothetical protein